MDSRRNLVAKRWRIRAVDRHNGRVCVLRETEGKLNGAMALKKKRRKKK